MSIGYQEIATAIILLAFGGIFIATIWLQLSKSFIAEIIGSFPLQLFFGLTSVATVLFIFARAIGVNDNMFWLIMAFALLPVCFIVVRVLAFSFIHPKETRTEHSNLNIGSFNKQIGTENAHLIVDYAQQIGLDILGISEVKRIDFAKLLTGEYPYTFNSNKKYGIGQAEFLILSKYKLGEVKSISLDKFGNGVRTEVNIKGKRVAVYLIHTTAPISPELFLKRNEGFAKLTEILKAEKTKRIIVMGDLNITPYSWEYRHSLGSLRHLIYNATKGWGIHFTWAFFQPLSTQLDHIFASKNIHTKQFIVDKNLKSDHNLIWAKLKV